MCDRIDRMALDELDEMTFDPRPINDHPMLDNRWPAQSFSTTAVQATDNRPIRVRVLEGLWFAGVPKSAEGHCSDPWL